MPLIITSRFDSSSSTRRAITALYAYGVNERELPYAPRPGYQDAECPGLAQHATSLKRARDMHAGQNILVWGVVVAGTMVGCVATLGLVLASGLPRVVMISGAALRAIAGWLVRAAIKPVHSSRGQTLAAMPTIDPKQPLSEVVLSLLADRHDRLSIVSILEAYGASDVMFSTGTWHYPCAPSIKQSHGNIDVEPS